MKTCAKATPSKRRAPAARGSAAGKRLLHRIWRCSLPGIAILIFWQWASDRLIKEIYVSQPTAVARRLYEMFALRRDLSASRGRPARNSCSATSSASRGGMLAGYALGRSPRLARIFEPYVMAFYGIPKIALAPLFIIWFGIGIWSKVALAATWFSSWSSTTSIRASAASTRELVNLTLVMGANQRQLTYHVYLPAAAPYVISACAWRCLTASSA